MQIGAEAYNYVMINAPMTLNRLQKLMMVGRETSIRAKHNFMEKNKNKPTSKAIVTKNRFFEPKNTFFVVEVMLFNRKMKNV